MTQRRTNPVFRSLNRPLTILGAERKLFFFALLMGAGVFNLLKTLFGGILMFLLLYNGESRLTAEQEQDLYHQIENLYEIEADLRTLSTLANTLERGHQVIKDGQYRCIRHPGYLACCLSRPQPRSHLVPSWHCSPPPFTRRSFFPGFNARTGSFSGIFADTPIISKGFPIA